MSEETERRINNIMQFVENTVIIGGYGYPYGQAIRMLYEGCEYDEVLNWYNSQIQPALSSIDSTLNKTFKNEA